MEDNTHLPPSLHPPIGGNDGNRATKLNALFASEQQKLQMGNPSFHYNPPKVPSGKGVTSKAMHNVVSMVSPIANNFVLSSCSSIPTQQVLYSEAVSRLCVTHSTGGSEDLGSAGVAIVGNCSTHPEIQYLIVYDSMKKPFINIPINEDFNCLPKPDDWAIFNVSGETWSAKFDSTEKWVEFARKLVHARSIAARFVNSSWSVVSQDVTPEDDASSRVQDGDMVQVMFKAYVEKYPGFLGGIFQETTGKGIKIELGIGKTTKGFERGMNGMQKGMRRFIVVSPRLGYLSATERPSKIPADSVLFYDVTVSRVRKQRRTMLGGEAYLDTDGSKDDTYLAVSMNLKSLEESASNLESRTTLDCLVSTEVFGSISSQKEELEFSEPPNMAERKRKSLTDRMAWLSQVGGAGKLNLSSLSVVAESMNENSTMCSQANKMVLEEQVEDLSEEKIGSGGTYENGLSLEPDESSLLHIHFKNKDMTEIDNTQGRQLNVLTTTTYADEKAEGESNSDYPDFPLNATVMPFTTTQSAAGDGVSIGPNISATSKRPSVFSNANDANVPSYLDSGSARAISETVTDVHPSESPQITPLPYSVTSPYCSASTILPSASAGPMNYSTFHAHVTLPFPGGRDALSHGYVSQGLPADCTGTPLQSVSRENLQTSAGLLSRGFPCFPWYPYFGLPVPDEAKHLEVLQQIQQSQEFITGTLKDLSSKVEQLVTLVQKHVKEREDEQIVINKAGNSMASPFSKKGQPCLGDDQDVDSLVESVALMLAENRELKRRLSEIKLQQKEHKTIAAGTLDGRSKPVGTTGAMDVSEPGTKDAMDVSEPVGTDDARDSNDCCGDIGLASSGEQPAIPVRKGRLREEGMEADLQSSFLKEQTKDDFILQL